MRAWVLVCALAVCLLTRSADAQSGGRPTMKCAAVPGVAWRFRCTASEVEQLQPKWTLYSDPVFFAYGTTATFPTPEKWSVIEMAVEDDIQTVRVRAWVGRARGRTMFRQDDDE